MQACTMDPITEPEIAAAIRTATLEVFSTMLGMEIVAGEAQSGKNAGSFESGVVALLGLAGDWVGSGNVSCEPPFACKLASQLLMAEYDAVNDDVLDAVSEVSNMIIGNVKTFLETKLGPMGLSTPTVIHGGNFETRSVGSRGWVIVPFTSGSDGMNVQISIAPNRGSRRFPAAIRGASTA
jgi:chemotaxis protein CheX